jgi:ATP-binding cassette subfamily F protein 3
VHVNAGQLRHYPGGYQYYLDKTAPVSDRAGLTAGSTTGGPAKNERRDSATQTKDRHASGSARVTSDRKEQRRAEAEERQVRARERKQRQFAVTKLEEEIAALEKRQAELTADLEKPETYEKSGNAVQINRELTEVIERLGQLSVQWEEAAARLATLEA